MPNKYQDHTGQKFGLLTAVSYVKGKPRSKWRCICECGGTHLAEIADLTRGSVRSCGCLRRKTKRQDDRKQTIFDYVATSEGIEVADDPQIVDNNYVVEYEQPPFGKIKSSAFPVKFQKTPVGVQGPSPEFGQHTEEVLIELGGYSWDDIAELKEEGVIG